ncbi:MAG: OmpH family outer membrane protein [Flavobacterium sp.]|nr:OmpH family outer membrane protein [Flavobacterium sp.]
MRKHFLLLVLLITVTFTVQAQSGRGVRIGYIDMEYILQNVPDYLEAKNQLELKAQKWKQDAETKKNEINRLKESLKTERVLLTKELIEEREEEIQFQEKELSDFQQKKFGPTGELNVQKAVLAKPVQDQVFTAVQDIAEAKKYDFVFDKSSDLTMLFSAKRFDISDQVIRVLNRSSKRTQKSGKEIKEEEAEAYKEDVQDENGTLAERQKKLDEKKAAREKLVADRKAAAEQKKADAAAKRQQALDEKAGKTTAKPEGSATKDADKSTSSDASKEAKSTKDSTATVDREAAKKAQADDRAKKLEERKKALADKKAKAAADREAAKKAKEDKTKPTTTDENKND